ncbi:MAG: inositol monophosphatase family protein [Candidatus Krumholzibacteriia bacterium]
MQDEANPDLARLRAMVLPAGARLLAEQGRRREIAWKSRTELVTDLDRLIERELVDALAVAWPGDGVVAEEGGARASGSGRTWYLDPIDGTTNYVHDYPMYCVSLACADAAGPLLGAVYAPYLDELYLAARGAGAVLEQPRAGRRRALASREPVPIERALLATGFPYVRDGLVARNAANLQRFLMLGCADVRRGGSAALDLCHVGAGKLDGYWELGLRVWDAAAGTLVAREAGALVTDFAGEGGLLSGRSVLAAAPQLHGVMLEVLREGQA